MVALDRVPINVSLFRPLVTVDAVDGEWYAVVSDGTTRIEVVSWPLQHHRFEVDASAIIHIELFLAGSAEQFLRGERRRFAEVHFPALKARQTFHGSLFRGWFGLQRGIHHEQVNAAEAETLYEASTLLAQNLLTPKLCCTVQDEGFQPPPGSTSSLEVEPLQKSLLQHSNMIVLMHKQLHALWAQGKLTFTAQPSGELVAQLAEPPPSPTAASAAEAQAMRDEVCRLADEVHGLAQQLGESERLRLQCEKRLVELGEAPDGGAAGAAPEQPPATEAVPSSELQQLREALDAECARARALEQQLEAQQQAREAHAPPPLAACEGDERAQLYEWAQSLCADVAMLGEQNSQLRADLNGMRVACGQESAQCASAEERVERLEREAVSLRHLADQDSELQQAVEAQRRSEREMSELRDAAHGELDELRGTLRTRAREHGEQLQQLRSELQAQDGALAAETRLRTEMHDLEEAHDQMLRETKARFNEMGLLQERMTQEICSLRQEPAGDSAHKLASAHDANLRLREELEAQRSELRDLELRSAQELEARLASCEQSTATSVREGYRDCERRVAQLEAQLRSTGSATVARRGGLSPSSRSQKNLPVGQVADRAPRTAALDLAQAREKVAEADQELLRMNAHKRPLRESQPHAAVAGAPPTKTSPLLKAAAAAAAAINATGRARSPNGKR
mmetsp:Transcript_23356/g.59655  ORF Transcript_23356/g.59655 Transcript_23356/m.59655 type:complete len:684 (-) Transcript_23356:128-2179(-)